jgi:hypothetical protein
MRKSTLVLMGVLLFTIQALAQRTISGKVTDDKGNPVANVSVAAKGTTSGTTTSVAGTYTITVPSSAKILIFSSVDMATVELSIGTQSVINASMKFEDKLLSEVVVTGYSREKKSQFVGAATALTSKVVETVPVGSF